MREKNYDGGIGLGGVLLVTFIVLKLTGVINWSWWWVLSPIWLAPVVFIAFMVLALPFVFIAVRKRDKKQRRRMEQTWRRGNR